MRSALLLALLPLLAFAADPAPVAPASMEGYALANAGRAFAADIRDAGGAKVSRNLAGYELIGTGDFDNRRTHLDLDYEAKYSDNDFSGGPAPYGDTWSHFFGAHATRMTGETWGVGAVAAVEFAAENEADLLSDGFRGGGAITSLYKPSDRLSMETGIAAQSQFGQGPVFYPYVRWKWSPRRDLELEARVTGLQNGVAATWFVTDNKATSVRVSLFYETATYALRDTSAARGVSIGEVPLRVTLTQFLSEKFFVSARAEYVFAHTEGFYAGGEKIAELKTKPAPALGVTAGLRF